MLALPIFTASHPATIVGANELNFCVRDGNRWTLALISTNYLQAQCANKCIVFHCDIAVKKKVVTRTGFEPMLKA